MLKRTLAVVALAMIVLVALQSWADTIKLKNGKTIEGTVIKFGNSYRVKLADGTTQTIPESDVVSVVKGSAPTPSPAPAPAGEKPAPKPSAGNTPAPLAGSANFAATKQRADSVDAPVLAVTIWEKFIESNPGPSDLAAAKTELEKWQKLQKDNAEKINGKWVGGDDRKKLLKEVDKLVEEAREQMDSQTLQALDKYEKALKLYPNCFEAHFALGYYHLTKGAVGSTGRGNKVEQDKAIKSLEAAVKLRPNSATALSNLAIGYNFRERYEDSVLSAYKAAKIEDTKPIVENLVNCLVYAPNGMKTNNKKIKPIIEETYVLSRKYGISVQGTGGFHYLPPEPPGKEKKAPDEAAPDEQPGIVGFGSGFFVSGDGYIITNRHVAEGKNRLFRVRFEDDSEKSAEVIAIDGDYDIALLKIKTDKPVPYLKVAAADLPNPASKCLVLGYPVPTALGYKMQVTSGEVTSTDETEPYHVTLTANTTHGNSGGPIVDRDCNVIGVLSAGKTVYNATYVKALSAGQIRSFLNRARGKYTATFDAGKPKAESVFDGEKLALEARKATLLVLIIRGDGKEAVADVDRLPTSNPSAEPKAE
jgi:S1-C subfamily serine protease